MNKKRKIIVRIVVLVIIVAVIVCGVIFIPRFFKSSKSKTDSMQQTNSIALTKMDLTESVSATGTIESASTSTVSADIQNVTVKKVLVNLGDTVTKGQKLVTFDKSELKKALQQAKEDYSDTVSQTSQELSQAYQQLSDAQATYASDRKKLEQAVKDAEKALKKAKKAAKNKTVSSSGAFGDQAPPTTSATPTDNTESDSGNSNTGTTGTTNTSGTMTVAEAKAALKQARENLETTNKQNLKSIRSARQSVANIQTNNKKTLRQSRQSVQDAEDTLASASINATMDGTVTGLGVSEGSSYSGGDAVQISDLSSFQVSTTVDEYDITKIEKGQKVVILTDATGDEEIEGEITYVALTTGSSTLSGNTSSSSGSTGGMSMGGSSSSSSSSSSGYEVTIALKGNNTSIRSGMTAKCSIIINEASDVYAVPYDAIHTNNNDEDVIYVLDSSGAKKEIVVEKGMESDYYVEISSSELSEDLSVIIPSDSTSGSSSKDGSDSGSAFGFFGGSAPSGMGSPPSGMSGPPGF